MSTYQAVWRDGFQVIWRNLTWSEYQRFRKQYEQSTFEEPMEIALDIYRAVCIKGPDPNFVPAGIPGFICKQQMISNPFSGLYEDIAPAVEMARKIVTNDYLLSAKALIASTLNYRPEEIDNWDPNTFFVRLAQTEVANGRTFDPVDPKVLKDSKGRPIPPNIKKNLSPTQQKALDRAKSDRGRG
jgi:hypothetical protein